MSPLSFFFAFVVFCCGRSKVPSKLRRGRGQRRSSNNFYHPKLDIRRGLSTTSLNSIFPPLFFVPGQRSVMESAGTLLPPNLSTTFQPFLMGISLSLIQIFCATCPLHKGWVYQFIAVQIYNNCSRSSSSSSMVGYIAQLSSSQSLVACWPGVAFLWRGLLFWLKFIGQTFLRRRSKLPAAPLSARRTKFVWKRLPVRCLDGIQYLFKRPQTNFSSPLSLSVPGFHLSGLVSPSKSHQLPVPAVTDNERDFKVSVSFDRYEINFLIAWFISPDIFPDSHYFFCEIPTGQK